MPQWITSLRLTFLCFIECEVCGDQASGNHYGVYACDGCSGFFKRTSRRSESFLCKSYGVCQVAKSTRTVCKACRFRKCVEVGMNLEGERALVKWKVDCEALPFSLTTRERQAGRGGYPSPRFSDRSFSCKEKRGVLSNSSLHDGEFFIRHLFLIRVRNYINLIGKSARPRLGKTEAECAS